MYWNIATDLQQRDVQNLEGLFSLVITETIFTFTYSVLHTFPDELPKLLREINDGLFDLKAYYISAVISLVNYHLINYKYDEFNLVVHVTVSIVNSGNSKLFNYNILECWFIWRISGIFIFLYAYFLLCNIFFCLW